MKEREIDIATADGHMNTFVTHPERDGPYPVVLFYMDAPGKREELHDMARRLATVGYYVMLPNLYYRRVREFVMTADSRARMMAHMNSLSNQMVCADTAAMLEFAAGDPAASDTGVGCVGYCMSGPFAFAAAVAFPERMKAAASLHGVRLFTDAVDSPHLSADKIPGELYFGCAQTDEWAPPEMIDALNAHLRESGANYSIEWYPDTAHGFVFPQRPVYHKDSAERHWERLFALFRRNL
ncbi:MAG: dienelactone hydrolase family protein [Pseudomonadales bacterium]